MWSAKDLLRAYPLPRNPFPDESVAGLQNTIGPSGPFTSHLCAIFPREKRTKMREQLSSSRLAHLAELEFLESSVNDLINRIEYETERAPEALRELLGPKVFDSTVEQSFIRQKFFYSVATEATRKDYSRRIVQTLCFLMSMSDSNVQNDCGIELPYLFKVSIDKFISSNKTSMDIERLFLDLLSIDLGKDSGYHRDPLCIFPVAQFISSTNSFSRSESAQKSVSSIKYVCRGCGILKVSSVDESCVSLQQIPVVSQLRFNIGCTRSFSTLHRLHKGIMSLPRRVLDRTVLSDSGKLYVDGIDFTPKSRVGETVRRALQQVESKSRDMLMGFNAGTQKTNGLVGCQTLQEVNPGWQDKFINYLISTSKLQHYFCKDEMGKAQVKKRNACSFLSNCHEFERAAVALMHILMGGTSRATDYKQLSFLSGGEDLPARVTVYDQECVLVHRQSNKCALLSGKSKSTPALVPREWFERVLQYWIYVRPFCTLLATALERDPEEVERWRRFCYVRGNEKMVRQSVTNLLQVGQEGATFQRLRHASESIFRSKIVPKELELRQVYDYDKLLGHSYKTGLSYGVQSLTGTDKSHEGTDISSVLRCLRCWWTILGLIQRKSNSVSITSPSGEAAGVEEYSRVKEVTGEETREYSSTPTVEATSPAPDFQEPDAVTEEVSTPFDDTGNIEEHSATDEALRAINVLGFQEFSSKAQEVLIKGVLQGTSSVMGILPTGGGKTLAIMVSLLEKGEGLTVVIYPLRATYDDAKYRLQQVSQSHPEFEGKWKTWDRRMPLDWLKNVKVLIVTAEQAKSLDFLNSIKFHRSFIRRIVFDEAPVFVNSKFRLGLGTLPLQIRAAVACPFVLLSATVQPAHECAIRKLFHSPSLSFIRAPTVRPNISHFVQFYRKENLLHELRKLVPVKEGKLCIIFTKEVERVESISVLLQQIPELRGRVGKYHGKLNSDKRKVISNEWRTGQKPVLIATTAFAFGIHDIKCTLTIHIEGSYDLDSYSQAVGRSGRDGGDSRSIVLLSKGEKLDGTFGEFVNDKRCRLVALSSFMDSSDLRYKKNCGNCDRCSINNFGKEEMPLGWRKNCYKVITPMQTTKLFQERALANQCQAMIKKQTNKLMKLLATKSCFTCLFVSRGTSKVSHSFNQCPHWRQRCFSCGSKKCSDRKACKVRKVNQTKMSSLSLCSSCCLPPFILSINIHRGEYSMGRRCIYKDTIFPAMLLSWHMPKIQRRVQIFSKTKFDNIRQFLSWCCDYSTGCGNFMNFVTSFISTYK